MMLLQDLLFQRLSVFIERVVRHLEGLFVPKLWLLIRHLFLLSLNDQPVLVHEQVERRQSARLKPLVDNPHFWRSSHRLMLLVGD